jgi:hypothetical protein
MIIKVNYINHQRVSCRSSVQQEPDGSRARCELLTFLSPKAALLSNVQIGWFAAVIDA